MANDPIVIQAKTAQIGVQTYPGTIIVTPAMIVEKLQLSNDLSKYEKVQIVEWIRERYDNLDSQINEGVALIQALSETFDGRLSPESFAVLVTLVEQLFK